MKVTANVENKPSVSSVTIVLNYGEVEGFQKFLGGFVTSDAYYDYPVDQRELLDQINQEVSKEVQGAPTHTHFSLVGQALLDGEVRDFMAKNKKIEAIKRLRAMTGTSLLEAKNAIDALAGR